MKGLLRKCMYGLLIASVGAAQAQQVVNIGFSGPLSGGAAFYGQNVQSGIDMAIKEINKAGGVKVGNEKVTFNLVSLDDKYLPNETATNTRRLLQQNNAPFVFIPHAGGILTVQGFNQRNPEFLVVAYSSEPKIVESGNKLTFMLPPLYTMYHEPFVKTTMQAHGKKLGVIPTTSAYGKAWTDTLTAEWKKQGGTVGANNGVDYNTTTDYSAAVTKTLAEKPDVLFIGGPSQPTALVIKAAREQGFKGGFIVMDQAKFEEMDQIVPVSQMEGAVGVLPLRDFRGPAAQKFVAAYRAQYKKEPTSEMALNYMGVHALAKAMELAGTTKDVAAIRAKLPDALKAMPKDKNVYNSTGVDESGHMIAQRIMGQVKGGRITQLTSTQR
ncbi:ABC transporter substrate-binding protein [Deinococcus peraridilitoris]|uniref:ABC-type branched-chain amino acid transport system, periplasmic component n=1 Tax=Deinococcus peraridilitoris (strain DSM 19664 / LMG 22246 / CIP 109416 / KR-200) TaxID=937777 RepID=K9ZZY9_DEIPD|nr:ABC transporter substrate-binding protein [Deinococcus peraridilitoris]AFZ66764.1 ABC-type branched-chain amino acid transport system, periplasmic component [Deinococcus peraridilitoris DSM 19664]